MDYWNDFSFVTMFDVTVCDERGGLHELGDVKIGFAGQTTSEPTYSALTQPFRSLSPAYFSVGTDVSYYAKLRKEFSKEFREDYLRSLRDVVFDAAIFQEASEEAVFGTSLLRSVSLSSIESQFRRVLSGGAILTDYDFRFSLLPTKMQAGFALEFKVDAGSKPSTNIHALIGRNGVGKTTLLNAMVDAIIGSGKKGGLFEQAGWSGYQPIEAAYFSSVISISFSAFDPFEPPLQRDDPTKGTCYFYVGLKRPPRGPGSGLKEHGDLFAELSTNLGVCLSEDAKRQRWLSAIETLETDDNFSEMALTELAELKKEKREAAIKDLSTRMSSGHAVVLLTITSLVARLEEKTLVLFDEPESHMHPPLLSALIRCLSELLHDRNAVAILATHSPVVLQEVPKSCVWKVTRAAVSSSWARPDCETFGENVGVLTREVFGLEVSKSGFNALLLAESEKAMSYEEALGSFGQQVGFEGRAILRSLLHVRGKQ